MNQSTAPLTRRQAREIERRTGVRPVAAIALAEAVAASFQQDTDFIDRNEVTALVSVVPADVIAGSAEVPAAFAARSISVRAAKPAALVAKRRRRAVTGFAAAASAAAVATTGLLVPVAQGVAADAHSADLISAAGKAASEGEQQGTAADAAAPVVTNVVEAPAVAVGRADTAAFDSAAYDAAEDASTSAATSTGTATNGSIETSTATQANSSSAQNVSSAGESAPSAAPSQYVAGSSIVDTARQMIGIPYTGGNTPEQGFDCSGLVQYVYGLHGISLPRSVGGQAASGTIVSDPQPGDLVVMLGGGHIAIYVGNGMIIDAPDYGRSVNERAIWSDSAVDYYVRIG